MTVLARPTWLCPDDARRARTVDMEVRLRPVRVQAMGALLGALVLSGPWIGYWPVALCVAVGLVFSGVDRLLGRLARPELVIAAAWAFCQVVIAAAVVATGGPDSPAVAWLAIPVVTLATRFDVRGVVAGGVFTAVLVVAVTVGPEPQTLTRAPQDVLFPLSMLAAVAMLSTALMRSDIAHRTESVVDELTGLLNRRALNTRLTELAAQARTSDEPIGLLLGDLDHFKHVNDAFGHAAGDRVLADVAATLRRELRAFDLAYRLGGEEFVILLPGATPEEAAALAEQLRLAVAAGSPGGRPVTISFGVAVARGSAFDPDAVLAAADHALYRAKADGRDQVAVSGRPAPVCA